MREDCFLSGCAIQKPTSALCKGQGVVMSVGRGVMCISQFSEMPVVNRGETWYGLEVRRGTLSR